MREQRIFMAPVEDCNVIFRHSRLQKWIPKTLRNALRLSSCQRLMNAETCT